MSFHLTPESAAQTRQKNEESIRDEWIKVMQLRLVHDELQKCFRAEGENHYQVCGPIAKVYKEMLEDAKVKGYRTIDA